MIGAKEFENLYYRPEWAKETPQGIPYARGTASPRFGGGFAVYDGAGNYMGEVSADGNLEFAGEPTPYKESFLRSAAEQLLQGE